MKHILSTIRFYWKWATDAELRATMKAIETSRNPAFLHAIHQALEDRICELKGTKKNIVVFPTHEARK